MEVIEAIMKRRSVRKYLDKPVEWDKIGTLLDAGRYAPSSGNLQTWNFVVVTDFEKRKALSEACVNQLWMTQAPVHIVICSRPEKVVRMYGVRGERLYTIQNCAMAAQNIMLAAYGLGLGTCFVGAFEEAMVRNTLNLPKRARPHGIITIGYAAEKPNTPPRYSKENITYFEFFFGSTGGRPKDFDFMSGYFPSGKWEKWAKTARKAGFRTARHAKQKTHKAIEKLREVAKK